VISIRICTWTHIPHVEMFIGYRVIIKCSHVLCFYNNTCLYDSSIGHIPEITRWFSQVGCCSLMKTPSTHWFFRMSLDMFGHTRTTPQSKRLFGTCLPLGSIRMCLCPFLRASFCWSIESLFWIVLMLFEGYINILMFDPSNHHGLMVCFFFASWNYDELCVYYIFIILYNHL
jgi:hypothetical protein